MAVFRVPLGDGSPASPFQVEQTRGSSITVISLHGEIDGSTVDELASPLLEAVKSGDEVVLDLCASDYVDSSVIAAIVVAHRTLKRDGAGLRLVVRLESQPMSVLRVTGLYGEVPVFFTLGAAVNDAQTAVAEAR